jgi:hypothetical protein
MKKRKKCHTGGVSVFQRSSKSRQRPRVLVFGTAALASAASTTPLRAGGPQTIELPAIEVTAEADKPQQGLVGRADTATQGTVLPQQLSAQPTYRAGELLENVPGLVVTQHSGEGKANQYYLRGFNLDHGTDVAISVDDMPVNMPSQGHGQGYADISFMMPELLSGMKYEKGPYFANLGDFAAAGAVQMDYVNKLDHDMASLAFGSFGYMRGFAAMSRPVANGDVLAAVEAEHLDGPWKTPDNYRKFNGVLRYSQGTDTSGWTLTGMGYSGKWTATNQIPSMLVNAGQLNRFGSMDPSDGGDMQRYSVSGRFIDTDKDRQIKSSAYMIASRFNLYNNFTFFLADPVNGDQFHQHDDRVVEGANASYTAFGSLGGFKMENTIGVSTRWDQIHLGLFNTANRRYLSTNRTDTINEGNAALYFENKTQWLEKVRTVLGVRGDFFYAHDRAFDPLDQDINGGPYATAFHNNAISQGMVSPKGSVVFGPWFDTEFYASIGQGLHSNDVRAAAFPVQAAFTPAGPAAGLLTAQYPLLERALGYEVGVRTGAIPHLQSSLALFRLHEQSEQVFAGDSAQDEPSGPTTRTGVEFANFYTPLPGVVADLDVAYSIARFDRVVYDGTTAAGQDGQTVTCCFGRYIPGSPELVIGAGLSIEDFGKVFDGWDKWFGGAQFHYYGPRPLTGDNSVRSPATGILNLRAGYKLTNNVKVQLDIDNALNAKAQDVGYYYLSQTSPAATPAPDVHFHAAEPFSVRLSLLGQW